MPILSLEELKEQIGVTSDMGTIDDALLNRKIKAAQSYVESFIGYKIDERYSEGAPEALKEAVTQLAAFWYEHRGSGLLDSTDTFKELPFGIHDILREHRDWVF